MKLVRPIDLRLVLSKATPACIEEDTVVGRFSLNTTRGLLGAGDDKEGTLIRDCQTTEIHTMNREMTSRIEFWNGSGWSL